GLPGPPPPRRRDAGHRLQRETRPPRRRQIDLALGDFEGERLRPDRVLAGGQRREKVAAVLVGVAAGRDRAAVGLGRDGDATQLLAGRRGDRAAEQMIGGRRGHAARNESSRGERDNAQLMGWHGVSPWPFNAWRWRALVSDWA